jgi:hypothetical protein
METTKTNETIMSLLNDDMVHGIRKTTTTVTTTNSQEQQQLHLKDDYNNVVEKEPN